MTGGSYSGRALLAERCLFLYAAVAKQLGSQFRYKEILCQSFWLYSLVCLELKGEHLPFNIPTKSGGAKEFQEGEMSCSIILIHIQAGV